MAQAAPDIEESDQRVLVVGEVHGNYEMPQFAGQLLCAYVHKQKPVLLALEMPQDVQGHLQAYLASSGSRKDIFALLSHPFWQTGARFGQASIALLDLIEQVRRLQRQGKPVLLSAFRPPSQTEWMLPLQKERKSEDGGLQADVWMAHHLLLRVLQYPDYQILVLVGNRHAERHDNQRWMASFLHKHVEVLTLSFTHTGGTSWHCSGPSPAALRCGAQVIAARREHAGFDRVVALGSLRAAPPAVYVYKPRIAVTEKIQGEKKE